MSLPSPARLIWFRKRTLLTALPQPNARAAAVLGDELDASEFEAALSALRELVDHGVDLPLNVIEAMLELTGGDRSGVGRLAKRLGK